MSIDSTPAVPIVISDDVRRRVPTLFVETCLALDVRVKPSPAGQSQAIDQVIAQWAGTLESTLDTLPLIQHYRQMAMDLGADPRKTIPAVENLLRRTVLRGRFPRINSVVDAANLVSLRNLIPIGIFDFDAIVDGITMTLATEVDEFVPIGQEKPTRIPPGTAIFKDAVRIFSAVGSRDASRTMITGGTKRVLAVSWGKAGLKPETVAAVLDEAREEMLRGD
jgi:DNA/RNA-binding domain of Phe-tRNA-synthetase-like protein